MSLMPYVRKQINQVLWQKYIREYTHIAKIVKFLGKENLIIDHFAIIGLFPGESHGIPLLNQVFSALGYTPSGRDYLEEKQNEFMWLTPVEAENQKMRETSPQIVIADFNPVDIAPDVQQIILKYMEKMPSFPFRFFHNLCGKVYREDEHAAQTLIQLISFFLEKQTTAMPTFEEYTLVKEHNELLAWALVFGRQVNHFGINVEFLNHYNNLSEFNTTLTQTLGIPFNQKEGLIKGDAMTAIAQSSTEGELVEMQLSDKKIHVQGPFMEFVWRASQGTEKNWKDYFTGFIGQQATKVVESVYES
jgi:hypothetical protein